MVDDMWTLRKGAQPFERTMFSGVPGGYGSKCEDGVDKKKENFTTGEGKRRAPF